MTQNFILARLNVHSTLLLVACFVAANNFPACGASFSYGSVTTCIHAAKFTPELCNNAMINSAAEHDEKSPRLPSRKDCEKIFHGKCSIAGIANPSTNSGTKPVAYYHPRQIGFIINFISRQNMSVLPLISRNIVTFSPRSIMKKDTHIDNLTAKGRYSWQFSPETRSDSVYSNLNYKHPISPNAKSDNNFDCSSVIEQDGKDPSLGCYLPPKRR